MSKLKELVSKNPGIFSIQFLVFVILLILCVVLLATCSDRNDTDSIHDPPDGDWADNWAEDPDVPDVEFVEEVVTESNIHEFVTLGQYRGLPYDKIVVDDHEIEDFIARHLAEGSMMREVTDRAVQKGDVVIMDFVGSVDGVPFPGGSAQGADLMIGSGQFIPGFEEQLIGHHPGETFDIDVSFPESYHSADLAGKDAVFEINLISIYVEVPAELDDEFVQSLGWKPQTVAEYRAYIRERLEESARMSEWHHVLQIIIDSSTIHKLPIDELELRSSMSMMQFYYEAASYGMEIEEFIPLAFNGISLEDFINHHVRPYAINDVIMDIVVRALAAQLGIRLSEEEFNEGVMIFVDEFGYESAEEFIGLYSEEVIHSALLSDKVRDVVLELSIPN